MSSHYITLEDIIHLDYNVNGSPRGCASTFLVALPSTSLPSPGNKEDSEAQLRWGVLVPASQRQGWDLLWAPRDRAGCISGQEGVGEPVHVHPRLTSPCGSHGLVSPGLLQDLFIITLTTMLAERL